MQPPNLAALRLTFDEEFDTFLNSPDGATGTWMTSYPYGGLAARTLSGNSEGEYYSDTSVGADPFSLAGGVLEITARPAPPGSTPANLPYTSGIITTDTAFSQTYGYFETRAQLPAGRGLWPAFWLLPASNTYTSELDVFEVLGDQPDVIWSSVHGSYGSTWATDIRPNIAADTSDGFHTYGVDWEPDITSFYLDGRLLSSAGTPDSMNTPMFMLLNLAVGNAGSWPGQPDGATAFPATMKIDYVRAYATANTRDASGAAAIMVPDAALAPGTAPEVTLGVGADTLSLSVAGDAWLGDARFTVAVDGQQVGGTQTVSAAHAAGAVQMFNLRGNFAPGRHGVVVGFVNDAYGGPGGADRNLFVTGATLDGVALPGAALALLNNGTASFSFDGALPGPTVGPPPGPTTIGAGADTLALRMSEDAWQGDAQFTVSVDGAQIGGVQTVVASHAAGLGQVFNVMGDFAAGSHVALVSFLNDAYGGTSDTDRNLFVTGATINAIAVAGAQLSLSGGSFSFTAAPPVPPATARLVLQAYDWRSHALLSGLAVSAVGQGSGAGVISLRSAHLDADGRLVAELWADGGGGAQNFGVALRLASGGNPAATAVASFQQSAALGGDWSIALNAGQGQMNLSAIATGSGIAGPTDIGTVAFTLPPGASGMDVSLVSGEVGAVAATPFTLGYAAAGTGADGIAAAVVIQDSYVLTATRSAGDTGRAITAADALAALRIATGLNPNAAPDASGRIAAPKVSPYQMMAADVNGDGRVTAADALAILRMATGQPGALTPRWIFVDESNSYWNPATLQFVPTRSSVQGAAPIAANIAADTRIGLVGVLTGAVLGRWAPTSPALPPELYRSLPTSYFQALSQADGAPLDQWGYGAAVSTLATIAVADGGALPAAGVAVYDTAANIGAALDQLQAWQAAGRLTALTFMETTIPVVTLSISQFAHDLGALSMASGVFRLDIGPGANAASASLSSAGVMTILGLPDAVAARTAAATIHYTLAPGAGVETIAAFRYGIDRLDIDLAGHATADLLATGAVLAGVDAIFLGTAADPTHAVILTGALGTAANLTASHLSFADGHALIT